jgi:hypothetical protein
VAQVGRFQHEKHVLGHVVPRQNYGVGTESCEGAAIEIHPKMRNMRSRARDEFAYGSV